MPNYILFINYTEQGTRDIKNSPARIEAYKQSLQHYPGVKILHIYGMLGPYDLIAIVEAPNEDPIARGALQVGSSGNVKVQFYRIYQDEEFAQIIANLEK